MSETRRTIELNEFESVRFPQAEIPEEIGEALWRNYSGQVTVEIPSFKTDSQWQLTAQGWVGHIPLTSDFGIALLPKVRLSNLFRMLEYAYRLKSFRILPGIMKSQSLEEFYERLAGVLSKRTLDRGRRGFYRAYLAQTENLPYLRGRLQLNHLMRAPWDVRLRCHYHEHTADVEENQILGWTLSRILQSGMCSERTLPFARQAFRTLQSFVSLVPFSPHECINRLYNRLNEDYEPLHSLCRFFLEHTGPTHELGDHPTLPFLVNMARLYELFVAEWLRVHLPAMWRLESQEKVDIDEKGVLHFDIDLVLYDDTTNATVCVLDTKYKSPDALSEDDIAKVQAYAEVKSCTLAFLVYPAVLGNPLDVRIGRIKVRSLTFALSGDIEEAGQTFMRDLLTVAQ